MDPDVTLAELRELCQTCNSSDYSLLIDKFEALDTWLTNGGFLPQDWRS